MDKRDTRTRNARLPAIVILQLDSWLTLLFGLGIAANLVRLAFPGSYVTHCEFFSILDFPAVQIALDLIVLALIWESHGALAASPKWPRRHYYLALTLRYLALACVVAVLAASVGGMMARHFPGQFC